jgi:hypothetical protein
MTKKVLSLLAFAVLASMPSVFAAENVKIEFKQIRGTKPQPALVVQDADLSPIAQKQLDRVLAEGGMLDTASFKQTPGMNMASCFYEIKMNIAGKTHEAQIDEVSAPEAYAKLLKLILKYGHKPVQAATAEGAELPTPSPTPSNKDTTTTADSKPAATEAKAPEEKPKSEQSK